MSAIRAKAPLPVIPYATTAGLAPGRPPQRLLRAGSHLGLLACGLGVLFVPIWFQSGSVGPFHFWPSYGYIDGIKGLIPFVQTLCMGAGLALTLAGRPASRDVRRHPRYWISLTLNLLVFVALYCELLLQSSVIVRHVLQSSI